jgi:hypothetical protein
MPITRKDLDELPISFCRQDEVWVIVGPGSGKAWHERKIPLDGRKYKTGGTITFHNGHQLRASFYVDTTTFDFVDSENVYVHIDDVWYNLEEPELLQKLSIIRGDIYPLKWSSDRPLDYGVRGPYILEDKKGRK